ncbi:uncharacterized protein LOC121796409 [Salvia splendens]|uniref:uncharacterized protein LOC121796409 n=1 Tax=Salvia splendens TaxID=180675 RepID=UPI001C260663|nr:uncharacterized protein LOC121796409 [Salvia splendens]
MEALMKKYGVHHRLSTPYHPQSNGQVEISNREIKGILEKTVNPSRKDWSRRLDDALWAYRTVYKTPIEHKAYWAVSEMNMKPEVCEEERLKLMPGKLKSKWTGPYTIVSLRANGAVEIQGCAPNSVPFLVNGHRVKRFRDSSELCVVEEVPLRAIPTIA